MPWGAASGGLGRDEFGFSHDDLQTAVDIHRSVILNEVVIESDYPTYEENYDATRLLGAILEGKGFVPHYYYSGGKSIHVHVYFDWACLGEVDRFLQEKVMGSFRTGKLFRQQFMEWLRALMIRAWDTNVRTFDPQFIKASHLVRAELSRHRCGFKTFLGYTCRDLSFVPYQCTERNGILPDLGTIRLSRPHLPQELIEEFMASRDRAGRLSRLARKEASLWAWIEPEQQGQLKGCVQFLLSDEFRVAKDGFQRAMFILANEVKKYAGPEVALAQLQDWNIRMGSPVRPGELAYRIERTKEYTLTHHAVHEFLQQVCGVADPEETCRRCASGRASPQGL